MIIADNDFDDVLADMKAQGYAEAYRTNEPVTIVGELDGHPVGVTVARKRVKGRLTLVATWSIDGRRRGINHVRGVLRGPA